MPSAAGQTELRDSRPYRPSLGLKLTVFFLSLAICIGVFEVICRRMDIDFNPNPTRRFDAALGWTQERSKEYEFEQDGHQVRVQFNSLGFRDVSHAIAKPAGTKRIVVIGDSFSEAIQVNLEETYWRQLQTMLNSSTSTSWEVINLGVGDFGTAQEYRALMDIGLRYHPDIVLVQIFPLNDICNNTIELAGACHSTSDTYRPYFVEGEQRLVLTWAQPLRQFLRTSLVSFGVLEKAYLSYRGEDPEADEARNRERYLAAGFTSDPIFHTFVPQDRQPEAIVKGWRVTEGILRMIDEACRTNKIAWMPVIMPPDVFVGTRWQVFSSTVAHLKAERDYADRRVKAFADQLHVPSVSLLELFDKNEGIVLPYRGGHLNPEGHRLAAQAIYDTLLGETRLVPPTLPLHVKVGTPGSAKWMRTGWNQAESTGQETYVWSSGMQSTIDVPLPDATDIQMTFVAAPFQFSGSPQQRVKVVLNGTEIEEVPLSAGQRPYSVRLPRGGLRPASNTIEFRYAYARSPREVVKNSQDTRPLGVVWYSIDFSEAR
jgi:hypothetical protein